MLKNSIVTVSFYTFGLAVFYCFFFAWTRIFGCGWLELQQWDCGSGWWWWNPRDPVQKARRKGNPTHIKGIIPDPFKQHYYPHNMFNSLTSLTFHHFTRATFVACSILAMGVAVSQIFWRLPQSLCSTSCYDFPILLGNRLKHGEPETRIFECVLICLQLFFRIFWQHYCMWTHISFQFLQFLLAEFPYMSWACRRPLLRPRESHRTGMSRFKHIPKMGESEPWSPRHFCFYFWDVHKFHNGYFQKSYISVFDPRPQLYICFCCWGMTGMTLPKARVSSFHHRTYESDTSFFRQVLQGTTPKFNVEHHGTWWTSHLQKKNTHLKSPKHISIMVWKLAMA